MCSLTFCANYVELRPAFGSGEDWNGLKVERHPLPGIALRPAFGSGEDWNVYVPVCVVER